MDEIRKKIERLDYNFHSDYDCGDVENASIELLELCKLMLEQLEIQTEQLDRLADAVPSAGAHADTVRDYLSGDVSPRNN